MKRFLSLLLVACMLLVAMPALALPLFAADGDGATDPAVITRYTDYSVNFTVNLPEDTRNPDGLDDAAYLAFLKEPTTFAINYGDSPWIVGEVSTATGALTPFTRLLFMCNDYVSDGVNNVHDKSWASTEEQYMKRLDAYLQLTTPNPGAAPGVTLWDGLTPLWRYNAQNADEELDPIRAYLTNSGEGLVSGMQYTVEKDCTVTFALDSFLETNATQTHGLALLVDGEMVWPVAGGSLTNGANYFSVGKLTTVDQINTSLLSVNGMSLEAGQTVTFCVRGNGDSCQITPVLTEYVAGQTTLVRVDTYGPNNGTEIVHPGDSYTIPLYEGELIFLGWDANGDGVADYEDGATFVIPNQATVMLEALVVEPSRFAENMPRWNTQTGQTVFADNWTIGRYNTKTGAYDLFTDGNGEHIWASGAGDMWGETGGGFYLNTGKIAFSACTAEETYVNQIQHTVAYNGTVDLDFTKLIARREVNAGDVVNYIAYNLAIYKNGVKIWPADSDWFVYQSPEKYTAAAADIDILATVREEGGLPFSVDVNMGDTIEFRIQQGNNESWMFYSEPCVTYKTLDETPVVASTSVTVGQSDLGLNAFVQLIAARENSVAGLLYWTEAQTEYDPATGTDMGTGTVEDTVTKFTYRGLSAKQMGDILYVMPYATVAGEDPIYGAVTEISVRQYVENARGKVDAETDAFLVALLNYGAEAQKYFNYNRDNLANDFFTDDEKTITVSDLATSVYAQSGEINMIKTVSLICDNRLGFKFMIDAVEGATEYVLEYADNADFTDSTTIDMTATESGTEYKGIVYINNSEILDTIYVRAVVDGEAGATLTYSVGTYVNRMQDNAGDALFYLMHAILTFGELCAG